MGGGDDSVPIFLDFCVRSVYDFMKLLPSVDCEVIVLNYSNL